MKLLKDMMLMAAGGAMVLLFQKYSRPVIDAASDAMCNAGKKIDELKK